MNEELLGTIKKWATIGGFFGLALLFAVLRWRAALLVYVLLVGAVAILAILIQSGRGGGLAASLGGLGGDSLLGVRSATPIAKATYVMLALVLFICMALARIGVPQTAAGGLMAPLAPQGPAGAPLGAQPPATVPEQPAAPPSAPASEAPPAAPSAPAQPGGTAAE